MKSLFPKNDKSIFVKLRYLQLKIKKNKENYKSFCVTFGHNFKNSPLFEKSNISFERYYFVLCDTYLTSKMSKMDLSVFANKLFICLVPFCRQHGSVSPLLHVVWWEILLPWRYMARMVITLPNSTVYLQRIKGIHLSYNSKSHNYTIPWNLAEVLQISCKNWL